MIFGYFGPYLRGQLRSLPLKIGELTNATPEVGVVAHQGYKIRAPCELKSRMRASLVIRSASA